jgi:hypothetical protein
MPSSTDPGDFDIDRSRTAMSTWPSPRDQRLGIPINPAIRFARGNHFGASTIRTLATACQFARPPARIRPVSQPSGTFTSRLPDGSVTLSAAGYNYNSDWTPLLAGLSPAGMAASLAARSPRFRCDPFARDVAIDPGRASAPRVAVPHMLPSTEPTVSAPTMLCLSWLIPTPHTTAMYASRPPSPTAAQHSLPGGPLRPYLGRTFTGWVAPA